jgi:hypothetical protein
MVFVVQVEGVCGECSDKRVANGVEGNGGMHLRVDGHSDMILREKRWNLLTGQIRFDSTLSVLRL